MENMNEEVKNISKYWVNRIKTLVMSVNMAIIDDDSKEILTGYESMVKIQPESILYSKFNLKFAKLFEEIRNKFVFEPAKIKWGIILLPDLKKENYFEWEKARFAMIDLANDLENEFDILVEKNIKAKISIVGITPVYNAKEQKISFDDYDIFLQTDRLESAYCQILFNQMVKGQNMSWDEFWEKINGVLERKTDADSFNYKQVYDIHNRLNKKIKKELKNNDAKISLWKNKNIIRTF